MPGSSLKSASLAPPFPLLTLHPALPQPTIGQLLGKVCRIRCSLSSFAFMVRTQYAKHSPSFSSSSSPSALPAAANAIIILTTLVLCLSGPSPAPTSTTLSHSPAAGRARRALLLALSSIIPALVWPFSVSIFSFYLLLIFLLLLLLLLHFLACILLISRRPQYKGLRRGGGA